MPEAASAEDAVGDREVDTPSLAHPGERRDIDLVYRTHASWLKRTLRRRFGVEAAEDLSQEAFSGLSAMARPIAYPRALLVTIATNAARHLRRRDRRHAPDSGNAVELWETASWRPQVQDSEVLLKQLILSLPAPLQNVFILHRFEGLTYPEIAQRLGISIKTVEWRMSKAMAICAARLRE